VPHLPRFRALALFRRRPPQRVAGLVIAGIRKPAQELMFAERSLNRRNPTHNGRSLQPETDGRSYPIPVVARHYPGGFKRVDAAFKPKGQSAWSILSSDFHKQNTTQGGLRWDSLSDF
jgi:hypothetical protein